MPRVAVAMVACLAWARVGHAETVVVDFTSQPKPTWSQVTTDEETRLLARFPHPHANGKSCDPNQPGTPTTERAGGILLPTITKVEAAITKTATQTAYLIDYCPTGAGVPRTRRLLVLDGAVAIDRELPASLPADEILAAVDVDGDGRAELVLTASVFRQQRMVVVAYLVRATAREIRTLGTWTAIEHCVPGTYADENVHRVTSEWRGGALAFRDTVQRQRCHYPPAP